MDKKIIDQIQELLDLRERVVSAQLISGNVFNGVKDFNSELRQGRGTVLIDVREQGSIAELSPFKDRTNWECPVIDSADVELLCDLVETKRRIREEYRSAILKVIDHRLSVLKSKI